MGWPLARLSRAKIARVHLSLFEDAWALDAIGQRHGTPSKPGSFQRTSTYEGMRARFESRRAVEIARVETGRR